MKTITLTVLDVAYQSNHYKGRKAKLGWKNQYESFKIPQEVIIEGIGTFTYQFQETMPLTGVKFWYCNKENGQTINFW